MPEATQAEAARRLAESHLNREAQAVLALAMENLRLRRARLRHVATDGERAGAGAWTAPLPRAAVYDAIGDVLDAAAQAEEHVAAAVARLVSERSTTRCLVAAAARVAAIDDVGELEVALPELALTVCPGSRAALLQVDAAGSVEVLSACGAPSRASPPRVADAARAALGDLPGGAPPDAGGLGDGAADASGGMVAIAIHHGPRGAVLALEWAPGSRGPSACEREHLAVYASLASASLSRARAGAALREAAARDAATLGAILDGVLAVDGDGVVRALNDAGAAALGLRRESVLGRRLRDVPGLAALALALAAPSQVMDVVAVPRGEVTVRSQRYDGGIVATLRDVATEHAIAQRMVGSVARYTFDEIVGTAPVLREAVEDAKQVARSDIPVLICGESGTGKEVLAQAIHNASPRSAGPFLGINVTAIPRELLESELFGYEGGTFTGARAAGRAGKFELAGNGTLLLDEIGDMPLEMQSKLLRVLQERVVQRLGSARDIPVRARIIATTHHDLVEAVDAGRFRLDLYHRLCAFRLCLAPLRERQEDVAVLVEHRLRLHQQRTGRKVRVVPAVLAALEAYDWPGNVRELINVIEGELSVLREGGDVLTRIPPLIAQPSPRARSTVAAPGALLPLDELERRACEQSLIAHRGNVAGAARALGVAKGTLYAKMKRYGLGRAGAPGSDRPAPLALAAPCGRRPQRLTQPKP